jgi:hypothetical protein
MSGSIPLPELHAFMVLTETDLPLFVTIKIPTPFKIHAGKLGLACCDSDQM